MLVTKRISNTVNEDAEFIDGKIDVNGTYLGDLGVVKKTKEQLKIVLNCELENRKLLVT